MAELILNKQNQSILRYNLILAGIYSISLIIVNTIIQFTGLDISRAGGLAALLTAVYATVAIFVQKNGRAPNKVERKRLTRSALLISVISSLAITHVWLLIEGESLFDIYITVKDELSIILLGAIAIIILLIYYLILGTTFLMFGKIIEKQIRRG